MEGPHHNAPWAGYDAIPSKTQPEPFPGSGISAWEEPWEGPMNAMYALSSSAHMEDPIPTNNNLDMARWSRETLHPRDYMNFTYWTLWHFAVCRWLDRGGLATRAELTGRGKYLQITDDRLLDKAREIENTAKNEPVPGFGGPVRTDPQGGVYYTVYEPQSNRYQEASAPKVKYLRPKFKVGDRVKAILQRGSGHTREYAMYRGRVGTVVAYYGVAKKEKDANKRPIFKPYYQAAYPDIASKGNQEFLVPMYQVRFDADNLWGKEYVEPGPSRKSKMYIFADMFEPYIKHANG